MFSTRFERFCCLFFSMLIGSACYGHHILGIPHYAYDEEYPQTPILTYLMEAGPYEVRVTGYPGKPEPGERCSLHVYIRRKDDGELFDGAVTLTVMRDRLLGHDPIVYGPIRANREQSLFKFFPQYEHESNYTVRVEFDVEDVPWIVDLPMVAGEPGSPWLVVGTVAGSVVLFLILVRAIRIKVQRRARSVQNEHLTDDLSPVFPLSDRETETAQGAESRV